MTQLQHTPTHDIVVISFVSACMVLIAIWAFADSVRLARMIKRGEA